MLDDAGGGEALTSCLWIPSDRPLLSLQTIVWIVEGRIALKTAHPTRSRTVVVHDVINQASVRTGGFRGRRVR